MADNGNIKAMDFFACIAMHSILCNHEQSLTWDIIVKRSYEIADAMLIESESEE